MSPSQRLGRGAGGGGTTCATGSPNRVTRTGLRVLRTRSSTPRQVALNFEIAIFSITGHSTMVNDHSQSLCDGPREGSRRARVRGRRAPRGGSGPAHGPSKSPGQIVVLIPRSSCCSLEGLSARSLRGARPGASNETRDLPRCPKWNGSRTRGGERRRGACCRGLGLT